MQAPPIRPTNAPPAATSRGTAAGQAAGRDSFAGILDGVNAEADAPATTSAPRPVKPTGDGQAAAAQTPADPAATAGPPTEQGPVKAKPKAAGSAPTVATAVASTPDEATVDPGQDPAAPASATTQTTPEASVVVPLLPPGGGGAATAASEAQGEALKSGTALAPTERKALPSIQAATKPDTVPADPTAPASEDAPALAVLAPAHPPTGRRAVSLASNNVPPPAAAGADIVPADLRQLLPAVASSTTALPQPPPQPAAGTAVGAGPAAPAASQPAAPAPAVPPIVLPPPAPVEAAAPGAAAEAPPVARQVAAALVQLTQGHGGNTVTLRLDPAELGHVQVRIDRQSDGTSTVHVAVERPETLRLLMADQPALHRTLDSAGLSQDGRSLNFSLATPDNGGNASPDRGGAGGGFMGNGSFAGQGGGQHGGGWRQDRSPYPDTPLHPTASASWLRAGVDITA